VVDVCVCTPHTFEECEEVYDHKEFDSLEEIQKAIISLYWGLTHNNINWEKKDSRRSVRAMYGMGRKTQLPKLCFFA
jgi:hypothetical protein